MSRGLDNILMFRRSAVARFIGECKFLGGFCPCRCFNALMLFDKRLHPAKSFSLAILIGTVVSHSVVFILSLALVIPPGVRILVAIERIAFSGARSGDNISRQLHPPS